MTTISSDSHDSIGWRLTATDLGTVIPALLFVVARLYTKAFITKAVGWEDYLSIGALLVAIARTTLDIVAVQVWDLGHHFKDVPLSALRSEAVVVPLDGHLYVLAITLAKLSILLFLYRIFSVNSKFRIVSWIVGVVISVWASVTLLLGIFACKPIIAQFNFELRFAPSTVCSPEPWHVQNIYGFCNIIADFVLLLMPMPMLWNLKMVMAKRIGVAVVFASGIL